MLDIAMLQSALQAFQTTFGSLGVFFTYLSFHHNALGTYAVLFLASAMAILWTQTRREHR